MCFVEENTSLNGFKSRFDFRIRSANNKKQTKLELIR